jgi:hypothetical protein
MIEWAARDSSISLPQIFCYQNDAF